MSDDVEENIIRCMVEWLSANRITTDIFINNLYDTKEYIRYRCYYEIHDNLKLSVLKSHNLLKKWKFYLDKTWKQL